MTTNGEHDEATNTDDVRTYRGPHPMHASPRHRATPDHANHTKPAPTGKRSAYAHTGFECGAL